MFKNIKIKTKLLVGFIFVAIIAGVIGYIGMTNIRTITEADKMMYEKRTTPIEIVGSIIGNYHRLRGNLRDLFLTDDKAKIDDFLKRIESRKEVIIKYKPEYEKTYVDAEDKELFEVFLMKYNDYITLVDKVVALFKEGKKAEALALNYGDVDKATKLCNESLDALLNMNLRDAKVTSDDNTKIANTATTTMIAWIIVGMIVAILLGWFLARSLQKIIIDIMTQTKHLVDAAVGGKLDIRGAPEKINFEFRDIMVGINQTLDALIGPLNIAAEYVDRISKGDIPPKITDTMNGDFNEIKNNLNGCIDAINLLVSDAGMLVKAAVDGKLDTRADAQRHSGDFREIIQGVNKTLDAVIGPLNVAAEYVDRISKGDIPPRITDSYNGDFNEIKNNLNTAIDAVNALVEDADILVNAAIVGKLNTRADAIKHQGDFRKVIEGVNETINTLVGHLDNMPAPCLIIDNDFTINFMNKIGASVGNKTPEQVIGTKCYDHFKTSDCKTDNCACYKTIKNGLPATSTTDAHPGNLDLEISYSAVPIKNKSGTVIGAFEVVSDQTEIKKASALAQKIADYQSIETEKLVSCLGKLSNGDTNFILQTTEAGIETKDTQKIYDIISSAVNTCVQAIKGLTSDASMLAKAAVDGNMDIRADALKHLGDYREIIEGFNHTLNAIMDPVNEAANALSIMATGDLTIRMMGDYRGDHQKLKNSINTVNESLNGLLGQVNETVENASSSSLQISSTADTLAAGSAEQSAQADEVASAVEEMSRTITQNAMNATRTAEMAEQNGKVAKEGGIVVEQTVTKMKDIAMVVKQSADSIEKLGESSKQIGEIISVIDDIADQTNLLALNAAIEAARAGEQGRGFAVVADEVRKLAERTTEATKQIAKMIKGIQVETQEAVKGMQKGTDEVANGISLADRAGQALAQVLNSTQEVQDMINQIAAASEEQSSTSEQISKNVQAISQVTAESAKRVQDIASASDGLSKLTEQLGGLMSQFKIDGGGNSLGSPISYGSKKISSGSNKHLPARSNY